MSVTIEIPISDELLSSLDRKAREAGMNREEYLRALVARDLSGSKTLDEVLGAFRDQVATSGMSDAQIDELFSTARDEAYRERNS
ncbi:MAG TPA: hypothetical protein VFQ79_03700 [Bryobacteraceae bacterium]|nr:hypothetical protein [Bryobacteraceae bacterium]